MWHARVEEHRWWMLSLMGLLAIVFGIALILLPVHILALRIVEVIFRQAGRFSAGMTGLAAFLGILAVVAVDGLLNIFAPGIMMGSRASWIRGGAGVAVTIAAICSPDWTVVGAVQLIAVWAMLVGVLELVFARYVAKDATDRALFVVAAIASMAIGIGILEWVLIGAVVVSAVVGVAAMVRGSSLIVLGVKSRTQYKSGIQKHAVGSASA